MAGSKFTWTWYAKPDDIEIKSAPNTIIRFIVIPPLCDRATDSAKIPDSTTPALKDGTILTRDLLSWAKVRDCVLTTEPRLLLSAMPWFLSG
jgi:hypothetical protein